MYRIRDDVAVGYPVNLAMKQTHLFPHMVIALASLIEPMIMVILGVLVGAMVIGMYLPIFKLGATI